MDAATVGGFFISAFLQVLFDRIAPREIWDFFRARKLDEPLRKLEITLIAVNKVIQDAEDKKFDYPLVGEWLQKLQGAVYDAEDLLDAVNTEAMQLRLEEESSSQSKNSKPLRFFFSSNTQADWEMEAKLNEILEELEYLKNQKDVLGLKEVVGQKPSPQLVYNDDRVKEHFREEARAAERRRQEKHIKQVEREWAQTKKELQQERDNVRSLTSELEQTVKNALRQVEEMKKKLANALPAVQASETRSSAAEKRAADAEMRADAAETRAAAAEEKFKMEHKKHTDEVASKIAAVLQRAEEQGHMIESLHTEATKKAQEKAAVQLKLLEEDLEKSRNDIISLQSERDKLALDAKSSRDRFDGLMGEFEQQKQKLESLGARNEELSQLNIDHQKEQRESSEAFASTDERSRKLSMEVSVLKHEKEMLSNAKKRLCDKVHHLSGRFYRLRRQWAQAKKELQQKRDNVRSLTSEREQTMNNATRQVEEMGNAVLAAETRATAAEARATVAEARRAAAEDCPICNENRIELAFSCGHMSCKDCESKMEICPFCRKRITHCQKLFSG